MRHGPDFSVSSNDSGNVMNTRESTATTPAATQATGRLRVMKSITLKIATTATERSAWLMPAR